MIWKLQEYMEVWNITGKLQSNLYIIMMTGGDVYWQKCKKIIRMY